MNSSRAAPPVRTLGRYALFDEIASGGMATVHLGRLMGPVGFSRTVAIKRLHSHFARDPEFADGFVDEARLAARIHHPNVVPIIDVLAADGELSLVMDYVEGDSLAKLLRQSFSEKEQVPLSVASSIICGSLYGLHAAHEAVDEKGRALELVHRDVSPQNILVGVDGIPRLVDFGVAKAAQRLQTTAEGQVKGKVAYMAPEQIRQAEVGRTTDIYAMGVVLWESVVGKRLFQSDNPANLMTKVLEGPVDPPSMHRTDCPPELDEIIIRALNRDPNKRFKTARQFAQELQSTIPPAPPTEVSDWVAALALDALTDRRRLRARVESHDMEAPADHREEVHRSSPDNEDLLTVVEPRPLTSEDDSTQAVTGTTVKESHERKRLLIPLFMGLGAVAAAIGILIALSPPQLGHTQTGVPAPRPAPAIQTEPPRDTGEKEQKSDSQSVETKESASTATDKKLDAVGSAPMGSEASEDSAVGPASTTGTISTAGESNSAKKPPQTRQPTAPTSPAKNSAAGSCPKFIVDAEGIRRVNRKCWK